MNDFEIDPKLVNELSYLLTDLLAGDEMVVSRPEYKSLDLSVIQKGLDFLLNNPMLDEKQKADLIANSWRINYRDKPPTPENFITEKYLGPAATHTYQYIKDVFVEFMDPTKPYRNLVLYPFIGYGKHVALNTKVHTPTGPVLMKDLEEGDVVSTPDGKSAKVKSTRLWENEEFAKITFADGRTVDSGLDHFYKAAKSFNGRVWDQTQKKYVWDKERSSKPCWKIITLREIINDLEANPKARWFVPLTKPVFYKEVSHVIHPYNMGALLGDGHLGQHVVSLVGNDKEIFDEFTKNLPSDLTIRYSETPNRSCSYVGIIRNKKAWHHSSYQEALELFGLRDTPSFNKFIPKEYLYDSIKNRIALLQGLMDTDGTISKKTSNRMHIHYYTTSPQLRDDIITLIRGLGGRANYSEDKRYLKAGAIAKRPGYVVYFTFPDNSFPVFRLKRKQDLLDHDFASLRVKDKPKYLYFDRIDKLPNQTGKCIELDNEERLFLVDDYIVTHNSYLTTLVNIYIGIHLSMMRNPYKYFGLNPATILCQLLVSYSLKKSSELLLEPMIGVLESSPFFEKKRTKESMRNADKDFDRTNNIDRIFWTTAVPTSAIQFSNGANFKLASNPGALLGLSVVSGSMSELAFFRDAGRDDAFIMRIFNDLKGRIDSRMKGNYFGRSILDSSPNTLDSPIDDYIVNHAKDDNTNFIVQGSVWKWRPEEYDMSKTFNVYTGGKGQPPRILITEEEKLVLPPQKVIEVPLQLKQFFVDDIYKALKDRAGIPSGSADALIYDYSKIEGIFNANIRSIYKHIHASSEEAPSGLIWKQIEPIFFRKKAGRTEFWYKPHLPRYFSADLSISGDVTGLAMSHVERIRDSDDQMFMVDMVIPIAPGDGRINVDAVKLFIEDLRNLGGLNIAAVSFDQFQSESTIQYLKLAGFQVEKLSVDSTMDPYMSLLSLMDTKRIVVGRNLYVKNNLKSLKIVKTKSGKNKIDHADERGVITTGDERWETSQIGTYAKDCTDAIAASIELCKRYQPVAFDFWDADYFQENKNSTKEQDAAFRKMQEFMKDKGLEM